MLYRFNVLYSNGDTKPTETYVNLLAPKAVSVHHALRHGKLIHTFDQVQQVIIHDSLPNYWPDRITVVFVQGDMEVRGMLVRLRNNNN